MSVNIRLLIICFLALFSKAAGADQASSSTFPIISDLDEAAKVTWDEILECANGDADKARKAYFEGKYSCYNGNEIKSKLVELHAQLRNFLQTAEIGPFNKGTIRQNIHPLLSEILLEIQSTVFKFSSTYSEVVPGSTGAKWIEPSYGPEFNDRLRDLSDVFNKDVNTNIQKYDLARLFANSVGLAKMIVAKHNCSSIGLWPLGSKLISKSISLQQSAIAVQLGHPLVLDTIACIGDETGKLDYKKTIEMYRRLAKTYGIEIYRETKCVHDFLNFINPLSRDNGRITYCISLDPNNPQDQVPVRW